MTDKQILSRSGYQKILDEINERENVIRKNIADDIEKAREQGDLSENSAYKAAMEAKEFNETQITNLKEMLANSEVVETFVKDKIALGVKVVLRNTTNNTDVEYTIVSNNEADPSAKKISLESPIGSVLFGKKKGDTVKVETPAGFMEFIIMKIS